MVDLKLLFENFNPKKRGFINKDEADFIRMELGLEDKKDWTEKELTDLRNSVVIYYKDNLYNKDDDIETHFAKSDKMSAIVHMIDLKKYSLGYEV